LAGPASGAGAVSRSRAFPDDQAPLYNQLGMRWASAGLFLLLASGCRDLSGFTTHGDRYEGAVVSATFVRAGVPDGGTRLCLTIDTDHLQDPAPGTISSDDGRFHDTPLRTIPNIWFDPLSTFTFGEGRLKNLIYVASATTPFADGYGSDVFVVISLMQSGDVEVRLLRGAPALPDSGMPPEDYIFAVFDLSRRSGPCSY
jgi:hypothetical protein